MITMIERLEKGRMTMFGGKLQNQLMAAAAALMLSSIAVGSAVLPGVVSAAPTPSTEIVSYA